jgi:hypothetical protein
MEEPIAIVLFVVVFFFSGIGVFHVAADNRHFTDVQQQCKEQGFIQNTKTRILCQIEGAK